jgi:hypothetical protein
MYFRICADLQIAKRLCPKNTNPQIGTFAEGPLIEQCCGSGSGIRCLFDPWIRDPE